MLPFFRQHTVGYMPQHPYTFQASLEKNVRLGGGGKERAAQLIHAMGLTSLAKKPANTLSGGETARMALARTLMGRHDMLLLDEPCAFMDVQAATLAEQAILDYRKAFAPAVLLITHSIKQAVRIADEVLFLSNGCLVEHGEASRVLNAPAHEKTKQFLDFYSL